MSNHFRRYARHSISLVVDLRSPEGWLPCKTADVSRRGMFLLTHESLEVGQLIQLRAKIPNERPIALLCQVRRLVNDEASPGVGVEFMPMPLQLEERWDRFVLGVSQRAPSSERIEIADSDAAYDLGPLNISAQAPRKLKAHVERDDDTDERRLVQADTMHAAIETVQMRLRPSGEEELRELCNTIVSHGRLNLWFANQMWPGQAVQVVMIHPESDAERVLEGACSRCGGVSQGGKWPAEVVFSGSKRERSQLVNALMEQPTLEEISGADVLGELRAKAETAPTEGDIQLKLGWATLAMDKDPSGAAVYFQKVLALASDDDAGHWALIASYALMGQTELAYRYAEAALRARESRDASGD